MRSIASMWRSIILWPFKCSGQRAKQRFTPPLCAHHSTNRTARHTTPRRRLSILSLTYTCIIHHIKEQSHLQIRTHKSRQQQDNRSRRLLHFKQQSTTTITLPTQGRPVLPPQLCSAFRSTTPPHQDIPRQKVHPRRKISTMHCSTMQRGTTTVGICRHARRQLGAIFSLFSGVCISFSNNGSDNILLGLYVSCIQQRKLQQEVKIFRVSCRVRCHSALSCISHALTTGTSVLSICQIYIPFGIRAYASVFQRC